MAENTNNNNGKGFDVNEIQSRVAAHATAILGDVVKENDFAALIKWPSNVGGTRAGKSISAGMVRSWRENTIEDAEGNHISKPLYGIEAMRVPKAISDLFGGGIMYYTAGAAIVEANWHAALASGTRTHVSKLNAAELKAFIANMHFDATLVKELKALKTDAMRKRLLEVTGLADHGFDEAVRAINAEAEEAARKANRAALEAVLARQNNVTTEAKGQGAHAETRSK